MCDCGKAFPPNPDHAREHPGQCCDCFDAEFGDETSLLRPE